MENRKIGFKESLRCLIIFQCKLAADALRDLIMSPISIIMFLLDVILRPDAEASHYQQMLVLGRKSDRWINLFDQHHPSVPPAASATASDPGQPTP